MYRIQEHPFNANVVNSKHWRANMLRLESYSRIYSSSKYERVSGHQVLGVILARLTFPFSLDTSRNVAREVAQRELKAVRRKFLLSDGTFMHC